MKKYLLLLIIACLAMFTDLGTKRLAEIHLASEFYQHYLLLEVPEESAGATVEAFLEDTFSRNTTEEVALIANRHTYLVNEDEEVLRGLPLGAFTLEGGELLQVRHRYVNIIDGLLDFRYVENRGSAWGFLSDRDASFRQPFFLIVGCVALCIVFFLFRSVPQGKWFLLVALSLIMGGALGNLADRFRYGHVVDFINMTPGFNYPTYNLADVYIVFGVGMMFIQVIREHLEQRVQAREKSKLSDGSTKSAA